MNKDHRMALMAFLIREFDIPTGSCGDNTDDVIGRSQPLVDGLQYLRLLPRWLYVTYPDVPYHLFLQYVNSVIG